ncbi:hypothetical protein Stalingrad_26 [Pseudomonas phage Stalingrad]|uniref:Uncharacterized protein n=1 Tax=Pseudomonas phage Stalingrad TaxID=2762287 RepID=A0A7G8LJ59_9CAUD|nr:hypothetical protein Stalingrad_26 [Pseudomonas phage Stalingrad]
MKALRNFDIVTALVVLAGRIQAKRIERLKAREVALRLAIDSACAALTTTQRDRLKAEQRKIGE